MANTWPHREYLSPRPAATARNHSAGHSSTQLPQCQFAINFQNQITMALCRSVISLLLIAIMCVALCTTEGKSMERGSSDILRTVGNYLFEGIQSTWSERQPGWLWLPVIPAKVSKFVPLFFRFSVLPVIIVPVLIVSWRVVTALVASP